MANVKESLEHAEHAQHGSHEGGFAALAAFSTTAIAAVLACVTLLAHRSHNDTVVCHTEATRLQTESNIFYVQASDRWSQYQSKRIRDAGYEAYLDMLPVVARDPASAEADSVRKKWQERRDKYASAGADELADLKAKATSLTERAEEKAHLSHESLEKAEVTHHKSNRFDAGELAVELGLVLCSMSMLTRRKSLLVGGISVTAIGALVASTAFMLDDKPAAEKTPAAEVHEAAPTHEKK